MVNINQRRMIIKNLLVFPIILSLFKCTKSEAKSDIVADNDSPDKEKANKSENSNNSQIEKNSNTFIDPQHNTIAEALSYVHNASDSSKRKDETANCKSCRFYTPVGVVEGIEAGKCQVIKDGLISSTGWCQSWIKKVP